MPTTLPLTLPPVEASLDVIYHVGVAPGMIAFARSENSGGPQAVDIFEARAGADGGPYTLTKLTSLHSAGTYVARPVLRDENHLYFAAWSMVKQRPFFTWRADPESSWEPAAAVTIDGFNPKADDDIVPLEIAPDDCTLYFGVSANNVDGPYDVYRARRPQ